MKRRSIVIPLLALALAFSAVVILPQIIEAKRIKTQALVPDQNPASEGVAQDKKAVESGMSVRNDTSIPVREMKQKPLEFKPDREANENPKIKHVHKDSPDSVVQGPDSAPDTITANMRVNSLAGIFRTSLPRT